MHLSTIGGGTIQKYKNVKKANVFTTKLWKSQISHNPATEVIRC